jgi:hypothetical protein
MNNAPDLRKGTLLRFTGSIEGSSDIMTSYRSTGGAVFGASEYQEMEPVHG